METAISLFFIFKNVCFHLFRGCIARYEKKKKGENILFLLYKKLNDINLNSFLIVCLIFIYQQTNELQEYETKNGESLSTFSVSVPRPGIEPGWVAPLVFETSASTDSAIWAFCAAKVDVFAELTKCFNCFFAKEVAF